MRTRRQWQDVFARLEPGARVYLAGCAGEPTDALDALAAEPGLAGDAVFTGVWIPGVNRRDPLAGQERAGAEAFFITPALRNGFEQGRVRHLPLAYSQIHARLRDGARQTTAIFQVTMPRDGHVTLGPAADFTPALIDGGARLVGEVNERLPAPRNGVRVPVERFDALIEAASEPVGYDPGSLDTAMEAICDTVAGLIEDGDTVQFGLGKIQAGVLGRLTGHRNLALHGGMVGEAVLAALEAGAFSRGITTGVALGSARFYDAIAARDDVAFRPVSFTHDCGVLAALDRLVSVASALEVDLFGQVNAETIDGRQVSGQGGIAEFARGAISSRGGRSIVALPSTASGGRSRIVASLAPGTAASIARADVDMVVTETGIARLRGADVDARAQALISVAHRDHRDMLSNHWDRMRARM